MEIAPSVHAVPMLGATAFVIAEERLTVIDAGLLGARRQLTRYLQRIGRSLDEIDTIICTHSHPDHIGGVGEIARDGVRILMHPADVTALGVTFRQAVRARQRGAFIACFTRAPASLSPIEEGELLPQLGGLRVVHTPGHTPGSVCLYAERLGILFTGDVLQVIRGRLAFPSLFFSDDMPMARASIGRLTGLDVRTIAFSHYPPWRDDPNGALARLAARARARPVRGSVPGT